MWFPSEIPKPSDLRTLHRVNVWELIGTAFADRLYKKEYEMIQENILELVKYGLSTGLVDPEDKVYTINRLLELFSGRRNRGCGI